MAQRAKPAQRPPPEVRAFIARHKVAQVPIYLGVLALVIVGLSALMPALAGTAYRSGVGFRAASEITGSLLALVTGFALIIRFRNFGSRFHLLVGLAYFVAGSEDLVQGLFALGPIAQAPLTAGLRDAILATDVAGRLVMALLLLVTPFSRHLFGRSHNPVKETHWFAFSVVALTFVVTSSIFAASSLPHFMDPDALISRPWDFVSALVLAAALVAFVRAYVRERDMLTWWVALSIGIFMVGQVVLSVSRDLFDAYSALGHVYRVLAYLVPLLGFSLYQIAITSNLQRAENALTMAHEELSQVWAAAIPLCVIGPDGVLLRANEGFARLFDCDLATLGAGHCKQVLRSAACGTPSCPLVLFRDPGVQRYDRETAIGPPEGPALPCLVSATALRNERGELLAVVESFTDISALKRAEEEREALIERLEQKNTELEQYTYTVSHDLKSPLITITGFLGLLEDDMEVGDRDRARHDIDRIANAARQMKLLLDDLLELSRIGRVANPVEEVPLVELALEVTGMLAGEIRRSGAKVEIADDLPTVHGDRLRLRQVLQNLLDNALKFMGDQPDPVVEIGTLQDDMGCVCFVRDNGVGIDREHHERIFGLFDKLDPDSEGTGIGMALTRRIIEVHGGRIWVESEGLGRGSCFCFSLPDDEPNTVPVPFPEE